MSKKGMSPSPIFGAILYADILLITQVYIQLLSSINMHQYCRGCLNTNPTTSLMWRHLGGVLQTTDRMIIE